MNTVDFTNGKIFNRYWFLVMAVAAAYNFGMVLMDDSVVLYGTGLLGYTNAKAGLFTTAFSLSAIVFRSLAGYLSDRFGRRTIMLAGCAVYAVSVFAFGTLSVFAILILMRILNGAGMGLSSVAAGAASTETVPQEKMSRASTLFYVPMALAYTLCGYIALFFVNRGQYTLLYYVNAGILAVGTLAAFFCTYEKKRSKATAEKPAKQYKGLENLFEKRAIPCLVVGLCTAIAISLVTTFIMKYASDNGIGTAGLFFAIMGIVMLFFNIVTGICVNKIGKLPFLITLFVFFGIAAVGLGSTGQIGFFYMLAVGLGMLSGGCTPAMFMIAADNVEPERRGTAISTFLISNDIGIASGAVLWGSVIDVIGYRAAFIADGICIVSAIILSVIFFKKPGGNN